MFTDTHTHLYVEAFDEDRDAVIARAREAGVTHFFLPAIDSTYTARMLELQSRYPEAVYLMCGLHPTHVKDNWREELEHVQQELLTGRYHAVGEIGIDLYWDQSRLQEQKEAFRIQIRWAKDKGLPIVIHCREAFEEIFEVLEEEKGPELRGIFHCFTGTEQQAWQAIGFGMKLGIGGVATFKNGKIDQFLGNIPLQHIVLETDAPYLAPTPYRGKRNESAYLTRVVERLSDIYGLSSAEIGDKTTRNAEAVFGLQFSKSDTA